MTKRLRFEILRRDNYACHYCGATAPGVRLVVDAVLPEALGGSHKDPANLVAACESCNNGKSATPPDAATVAQVAANAAQWAQAKGDAAAEMLAIEASAREQFARYWHRGHVKHGPRAQPADLAPGWEQTVSGLLRAGLSMPLIEECVDIAMGRRNVTGPNVFRYMCGVAWNKVRDVQDAASSRGDLPRDDETRYEAGRYAAASEILEDLPGDQRDMYLSWADDGGYGDAHGDPQTDADRLVGTATIAMNDIGCDLSALSQQVARALADLPGEVGQLALRDARVWLYGQFGADFNRTTFAMTALTCLGYAARFREAAEYMASIPAGETREWLRLAEVAYPDSRGQSAQTVHAAELAQMVTKGRFLDFMCHGRGEKIDACPARGDYRVRLAHLDCCESTAPEDHAGHAFCESHAEQVIAGDYVSKSGAAWVATDYTAIESEPVPF